MGNGVLKDFLEGCFVPGVGEGRVYVWDEGDDDDSGGEGGGGGVDAGGREGGWEGLERSKRATFLLARCLREMSVI